MGVGEGGSDANDKDKSLSSVYMEHQLTTMLSTLWKAEAIDVQGKIYVEAFAEEAILPYLQDAATISGDVSPPLEGSNRSTTIQEFEQGYRDQGGKEEWLEHFTNDVMPCEGGVKWYEFADYSYTGYISPAQFDPASWATAALHTGYGDPTDPFSVGANVAWWSNNITDPWGTEGWPICGGW